MPVLSYLLGFILLFSPVAQSTETKTHFLIDLDSQQILVSSQSNNNVILPSFLEKNLKEMMPSHLTQTDQTIATTQDLLKLISRIPIEQWQARETTHVNSDLLRLTSKTERDILTSETTKIISHQNKDNRWSGIYFSQNPLFNGTKRSLLVILVNYSHELDLLKQSALLIEKGHWNFSLHTILRKGQFIGQAPVFKGSHSHVRFVIHDDIKVTLPNQVDLSSLAINLMHSSPLIAPIETHTALGHLTVRLGDKELATSPFFAEVPIETGNFLHRLCDTIRLVIFPH